MASYCLPTQGLKAGGSTSVDLKCNHVLTAQTETILDLYRQLKSSNKSSSSKSSNQYSTNSNKNSYYNHFSTEDSCLPFGRPLTYPFIHAQIQ